MTNSSGRDPSRDDLLTVPSALPARPSVQPFARVVCLHFIVLFAHPSRPKGGPDWAVFFVVLRVCVFYIH